MYREIFNMDETEKLNFSFFAHKVVQSVLKKVQDLKAEWEDKKDEENRYYINCLIRTIGKHRKAITESRSSEIFCYLAAAALYSKAISVSCHCFKSKPNLNHNCHSEEELELSQEHIKQISLQYLNELSKSICINLESSFNLELDSVRWKLASIRSPGNIPFMHVHSDSKREVYVRKNFEFLNKNSTGNSSVKKYVRASTLDMDISNFPLSIYQNGLLLSETVDLRLSHLIPNEEKAKTLFMNKYVTWIQVSKEDKYRNGKDVFEIDIIDDEIKLDSNVFHILVERLEIFAGCKRMGWEEKKEGRDFKVEDIIITFFSDVLFRSHEHISCDQIHVSGKLNSFDELIKKSDSQILDSQKQNFYSELCTEIWCNRQIKKYLNVKGKECLDIDKESLSQVENFENTESSTVNTHCSSSISQCLNVSSETSKPVSCRELFSRPMYIGLCFKTLINGGYSEEDVINGAKNLLLLSLVRGMMKLLETISNDELQEMMHKGDKTVPTVKSKWQKFRENISFNRDKNFIKWENEIDKALKKRIRRAALFTVNKMSEHPLFLGATNKGITIKTKVADWFIVLIFLGLGAFIGYLVPMASRQTKGRNQLDEFFGGLAAIFGIITGTVVLLTKCIYRNWHVIDIFHRRRQTKRLSDLSATIYKGKAEAIRLCSLMDRPEKVFSEWKACAFAHNGTGEFEIDEEITVKDLKNSGVIFGLDYYGTPIMADPRGRIRLRTLHKRTKDSEPHLHIGDRHKLKLEVIFKVPTFDKWIVGTVPDEKNNADFDIV